MHKGMMGWRARKRAQRHFGCHPGHGPAGWDHRDASPGGFGDAPGAAFGVRRPLRFLSHKLDLTEQQTAELAKVLSELKTERAQAEVDDRRTVSALADAVAAEEFDHDRAKEGGDLRVESAQRLRDAVLDALARIHALLDPEQREKLAYMIRTGTLRI